VDREMALALVRELRNSEVDHKTYLFSEGERLYSIIFSTSRKSDLADTVPMARLPKGAPCECCGGSGVKA
jgi:hypothetical protein